MTCDRKKLDVRKCSEAECGLARRSKSVNLVRLFDKERRKPLAIRRL